MTGSTVSGNATGSAGAGGAGSGGDGGNGGLHERQRGERRRGHRRHQRRRRPGRRAVPHGGPARSSRTARSRQRHRGRRRRRRAAPEATAATRPASGSPAGAATRTAGTGAPVARARGVHAQSGAPTLRHVTISGNETGGGGEGGAAGGGLSGTGDFGGFPSVDDGDDGGFGAGGGVNGDEVVLTATLVASNTPDNCAGAPAAPDDGGANLSFPDATCPGINGDPKLGAARRQRRADVHPRARGRQRGARPGALGPCPDLDQRGLGRPAAACDIGAFELAPPVAVTSLATGVTHDRRAAARRGDAVAAGDDVVLRVRHDDRLRQRTPDVDAGDGATPVDVGADIGGLTAGDDLPLPARREQPRRDDGRRRPDVHDADRPDRPAARHDRARRSSSRVAEPDDVRRQPARGARDRRDVAEAARVRRGTTFRYRLSEPARVVFTIQRARSGRRVGGRCRARTKANRKRRKCTRYVRVGRFAQQARPPARSRKRVLRPHRPQVAQARPPPRRARRHRRRRQQVDARSGWRSGSSAGAERLPASRVRSSCRAGAGRRGRRRSRAGRRRCRRRGGGRSAR